jgi:tetratricopeptide (TPR) repeat protein
MKGVIVFIVSLCFLCVSGNACLREYNPLRFERHHPGLLAPFDWDYQSPELVTRLADLKIKMKLDSGFVFRNDYAATLIHLGRLKEALPILLEIQKIQPNESNIAANLGMAYDLLGKKDSALYWCEEAWRLNPKTNTEELVHIALLNYYLGKSAGGSFTGLELSLLKKSVKSSPPWFRVQVAMEDLDKVIRQRLPFSASPDSGLAQLFWEYGMLCKAEELEPNAWVIFELARIFSDQKMIAQIDFAEGKLATRKPDVSGFLPPAGLKQFSALGKKPAALEPVTLNEKNNSSGGMAFFLIVTGLIVSGLFIALYLILGRRKNS